MCEVVNKFIYTVLALYALCFVVCVLIVQAELNFRQHMSPLVEAMMPPQYLSCFISSSVTRTRRIRVEDLGEDEGGSLSAPSWGPGMSAAALDGGLRSPSTR